VTSFRSNEEKCTAGLLRAVACSFASCDAYDLDPGDVSLFFFPKMKKFAPLTFDFSDERRLTRVEILIYSGAHGEQARVDPVLLHGPTSGIVDQVDTPTHGPSSAVDEPHHTFPGHLQQFRGTQVAVPALGDQPADPTAIYQQLQVDSAGVQSTEHLFSADFVFDTAIYPPTDFEDLPDLPDLPPEDDFLSNFGAWEINI
jgi:hypothetical protein